MGEGEEVEEEAGRRRRRASALEERLGFNVFKLAGLFLVLTVGITVPALSWYCAVPMTSMADITAIYNTFSVWALVFSVWFLGEKWEKRKVFSVLLACLGVIIVAYGGADHRKVPKPIDPVHGKPEDPASQLTGRSLAMIFSRIHARDIGAAESPVGSAHNPVLGDLLAFVGAVTMAAYEMAFKLIGTLPDEQKQAELYSAVPGGRSRRSRSYVRYADADGEDSMQQHETEGLLHTSRSEPRNQSPNDDLGTITADGAGSSQHVLGFDDDEEGDETIKKHQAGDVRTYSTVVAKLLETERPDYQSITPPPEPADPLEDDNVGGKAVRAAPAFAKNARIRDEDEESQVTESELDEQEEEQVLSGATRLHRTRSHLSTHSAAPPRPGGPSRSSSYHPSNASPSIPPPLPFGLHANIMTAGIGLTTFTTFWLGLILAHYLGWEPFELPHNLRTYVSIAMVVLCGIFFNAAFMILLSLWGPVLASVSCLMTTILVEIADVLLGHQLKWISVLGCALIGAGFAVLVGGGDSIH